uniref:Sulfotransfer_1 domain-containing protein n=1 Tax=Macrostomum lignano TaxID=282301 RepID=A0A1I8IY51_9PLAT
MSLYWRDWPVPLHSSAEVLAELAENFQFYDDDILVNTFPKCGTTLVQEIVSCLVLGPERTRTTDLKLRSPFIDLNLPPELPVPRPIDGAKKLDRPRVLKTHLPPAFHMRHLVAPSGPRNIIVMRNPKDAIVSTYHHMTSARRDELSGVPQEFSQFWRMMLGIPGGAENTEIVVHDFFDFNLSWWSMRRHSRVLILFYEDLIVDKTAEVKRMAEFLSTPLTEALLHSVLQQTSFSAMQSNPMVNITLTDPERWRPGSNFIRRGEIGDWKRHFSAEDAELVDGIIEEKLAGSVCNFATSECELNLIF